MNITKLAILTLFSYFPLSAMEIERSSLMVPESMGDVSLYKQDHGFVLNGEGRRYDISSHDIDPMLRKADNKQLAAFLTNGYIKIKQYDNGDYALSSHGRIKGGGPYAAYWGYGAAKGLIYGSMGIAAGAGISTVVTAAGGGTMVSSIAAGATKLIGSASGLSSVPGAAAAMASKAVVDTVGVAAVSQVSTAALAASGTAATTGFTATAFIAGVETVSLAVGAFLGSIPWLP